MNNKKILFLTLGFSIMSLTSCGIELPSNNTSSTTIESSETDSETNSSTETSSNTNTESDTSTSDKTPVDSLDEDIKLDIVEINDLHGYAYQAKNNYSNDYSLASTAYYINELRAKESYDNVVLIANGDMFQGTAFSNLSYGLSVVKAMNEMSFDAMGIGNHEFDWGLEKVLNYFDGNTINGEANFPLINGNVKYQINNQYNKNYNTLVGDNEDDNILPYTIVDKGGVKVGILSYIGPQTNDINQNKMKDFYIACKSTSDTNFINSVKLDALKLKSLGADIIITNIHEGSTEGIQYNDINKNLAKLTDEKGNYLIDAVINGHTHTRQKGKISRTGGMALPIVQGGSYGDAVGIISLTIDKDTRSVSSIDKCDYEYVDDVNPFNYKDEDVNNVLTSEYNKIKSQINTVYTVTNSNASRQNIGEWTCNIMKKYANSDIALINTGGIRASLPACNVTVEELYEINPFDNNLVYVTVKGSELINFYNNNASFYYFNTDFDINNIKSTSNYKLITIDYVYYSTYFKGAFKTASLSFEDTNTYARTLMMYDMIANGANGMTINKYTVPKLENEGWK